MEPGIPEIRSLLEYLIRHNEEHAAEILDLAERAQTLGNDDAYRHITRGVEQLKDSNESLRAALAAMEE